MLHLLTLLQSTSIASDNVVAVAIVTLASVVQGAVAISASRKTRKSVGEQITELRAICIGIDGKNGLRKDIADIKTECGAIRVAAHDRNNTTQAALSQLSNDVARLDERTKREG